MSNDKKISVSRSSLGVWFRWGSVALVSMLVFGYALIGDDASANTKLLLRVDLLEKKVGKCATSKELTHLEEDSTKNFALLRTDLRHIRTRLEGVGDKILDLVGLRTNK